MADGNAGEIKIYSRNDLRKNIEMLGIRRGDTLLIHSSLKSIGMVEGGADTVLAVFMDYLAGEGILILPTHSWQTIGEEHNVFDPETEPSCVGALTEIFRKKDGVIRSWHPTHSVGVIGKDADEFVRGDHLSDTPCPRNGCWGKLYDYNAKILFLGCSPKRNTYLHSVEEWVNVPDRLTEHYIDVKIKIPGESKLFERPLKRHFNAGGDISGNYDRIIPFMEEKSLLIRGKFGDADCVLMNAVEAADITIGLLREDIDFFGFKN